MFVAKYLLPSVTATLLVSALLGSGCGSTTIQRGPDGSSASGDAGGPDAPTTTTTTPTTQPGGPVILDFSINTATLDETQKAVFTVVVTDPDGIDDVIGGTLKSPKGASYGAFATSAAEGSYQITLAWADMNTIEEIAFPGATSAPRQFVAEFFDQSGKKATATVTLDLECKQAGSIACADAKCNPLADINNCGACKRSCVAAVQPLVTPSPSITITGSKGLICAVGDKCVATLRVDNSLATTTCDDACGPWKCVEARKDPVEVVPCTFPAGSTGYYGAIDCFCREP